MHIRIAMTDKEIAACYPIMRELRHHIAEDEFLSRIRRHENTGYRLAFVQESDGVIAVAGFWVGESLARGRFLYVDDFVTLQKCRSKGYGAKMMLWLKDYAAREGCLQLHLDSGVQRKDAHRFYEREGMEIIGYHFFMNAEASNALESG